MNNTTIFNLFSSTAFHSWVKELTALVVALFHWSILMFLTLFLTAAEILIDFVDFVLEEVDFFTNVSYQVYDEMVEPRLFSVYDLFFMPMANFLFSVFSSTFIKFLWFFSFIIPFSFLVEATASNEYLLFCCIVFTFFYFYPSLSDLVASSFSSGIQQLRSSIQKKLTIVSEVTSYQDSLIVSYEQLCDAFEEAAVLVEPLVGTQHEADNIVFEEALQDSLHSSLSFALLEQDKYEAQLELLEEFETHAVALEDLLADFSSKSELVVF